MKYKYLLLNGSFQEKKSDLGSKKKKKKSNGRNEETQQKCRKVMLGTYLRK